MIPKRIPFSFYLFFIFLAILSCQKKPILQEKAANNKAEISRLTSTADSFFNSKKFDSAFFYYNEIIAICSPSENTEKYIRTLNRMASIQQTHGDFAGSEATIAKALPYVKLVKKQIYAYNLYITLSNNYLNIYDNKNAIFYSEKALKLDVGPLQKTIAKQNIGLALMQSNQFDKALNLFLSLENNTALTKDQELYSSLLDHIGMCYYKINDHVSALDYMKRGLEIREKLQKTHGLGKSYSHLAELYESKEPSLAKKYMLKSYNEFSKINFVEGRLAALKTILKHSSDKELKEYSTIYINLVDSTYETTQKAKNQFARIKYDSKKEKEENLRLKTHKAENDLKLERQKNRNIVSYIIIVLSLCLILILYYYLTSKANREKIEAAYNSEIKISKKLHDELANDIYHTMAFAENRNLSLNENKEQLLNNLDAIYLRTKDISKENCTVSNNENYNSSLKEMISEFKTSNINLLINGLDTVLWDEISKTKKTAVYRAIQELLVNMKKHSGATLVAIVFKESNKNITIHYTDNGKGIDITKMVLKNGLHNIENRIHEIKGKIEIDSELGKGFKVSIKIPL